MASKQIQKYSTLLVIREMKLKSKMRYHYTLIIIVKIKKKTSVDKDVKKLESLYIAAEKEHVIATLENSLAIVKNLNINLLYRLTIFLLGIYP